MNTTDALISLQAMAPHLSSTQISNIFNNECSQDFDQSVEYLLKMAKPSITKIKLEEKSNNNKANTNTNESNVDMSDESFAVEYKMKDIQKVKLYLFFFETNKI